jgi:regulator of protease activity HflC (stomatin/prohibitin superfamily)
VDSSRSRHTPPAVLTPGAPGGGSAFRKSLIGILAAVVVIIGAVTLLGGYGSTDGGHIAVVRNGGPLDNTKIRQVVSPGSGRTRIGLYSTLHKYPTSQRFFTISSSGNADANESVTVPTADGVNVGVEGTAYFTLNTSATDDYAVLKAFDNAYGTRQFKCTGSNSSKDLWDGDAGFSCFLDQIFSPVINNDLRTSIGDVKCADLVSSCSLVQNSSAALDPSKVGQGNVNLANIEKNISSSLTSDLNSTLGGGYFQNVKFNLAKIDLDPAVQKAISTAQASFADVSQAQAELKKAQIEAQANAAKQRGYSSCPVCAQQDLLAKLPQGITVFAPGNSSGISLAVPSK